MPAELRFGVMGSEARVTVVGGSSRRLLRFARRRLYALERRWSRFLPDSEISLLNSARGRPLRVSPETAALVARAIDGWRLTGGRFDPTVLGAVIRAGYHCTLEHLVPGATPIRSSLVTGCDRIEVDLDSATVRLPEDVGFDPGGIGKGYAADLLTAELLGGGADGVCVSIGGDVRVAGEAPQAHRQRGWAVAVAHPDLSEPAAIIGLQDGAVATSSRNRRAWVTDRGPSHHLIDPATGAPASTGAVSASVVSGEAWRAEVLAKAAFLLGEPMGVDFLASVGADGLIVTDDGVTHATPGLIRFTERTSLPVGQGVR